MGWSSGTTLFEHVIETVQFHVPDFGGIEIGLPALTT